ncbi:GerAB/ArcD/ProY family transporter [Alkalicoccobacillus porphyridii]|uniref:GerAB/ArcD/ProY family transporter n=1 Tax=Alkalicoccobacillus porphyridii TaxID=2597270 RepID=A0A554A0Y6_9BACI|nr:GerAB/ArcD/ProY family transporter [Alkalicoccobacillus porphyridii]TSB47360.1 GerAB/ArcD/ProY family transporter [Alkalicoccobacillus porphyridii]
MIPHQNTPSKSRQLSPFFSFFMTTGVQISVGILGFERILTKYSGHDAWISVVFVGLAVHFFMWLSYQMLNHYQGDLVDVHTQTFGAFVGTLLNIYFLWYYSLLVFTVISTYIEVIQIWMFPDVKAWVLSLLLLVVSYAYVTKGLRVVLGLAVISLLITLPLLFANYFTLPDTHPDNILPVFDHSLKDILAGSKAMTLNILGFCVLFMCYPFFRKAPLSQKWSHLGIAFNMSLYLLAILLTTIYFSEDQLEQTVWATITLWKVVDLSVVERFEYIGVSIWLFVVLPSICLLLWSASRLLKRMLPWNQRQRTGLRIISLLLFGGSFFVVGREGVEALNDFTAKVGFYTIYGYIPILYLAFRIRVFWNKRRSG